MDVLGMGKYEEMKQVQRRTPLVVKPNESESALTRPLHVAVYEPDRPAAYLAATLSYGYTP